MILASNSPRRLQLLKEAGYNPVVHAEEIDETTYKTKEQMFFDLPLDKARAALETLQNIDHDDILIAADTTVWIDDIILGKPKDDQDALRMLKLLSGKQHNVSTAVVILKLNAYDKENYDVYNFVETTKVEFYDLDEKEILEYIKTKEPNDKAGSYGIQGKGRLFVKSIQGDYFNVVGLPIARLVREIKAITN